MNIIITGPRHCGKTTLISKILEGYRGSVSGFVTEFDNRESASRELKLRGINGSPCYCAVRWTGGSPEVFTNVFNTLAPSLIDTNSELIIIDELGKFEKDCRELQETVISAFASPTNVITCIRLDAAGWMQELKSRLDCEVIIVDENNRNFLPARILAKLAEN